MRFPRDNEPEQTWLPYTAATALPRGKVLVLAPHPDDEVFGCGGAIMQHVQQGDTVTVAILTDGGAAANADGADYVSARQAESRAAARILGYGEPLFWDYADRSLNQAADLTARLEALLTETDADCVYAPSVYEVHPDHYAVAVAAVSAVAASPRQRQLCLYEVGACCVANLLLDITPYVARKRQAVRCFGSQLQIQAYAEHVEGLDRYRTYTLPSRVQSAEAFCCVDSAVLHAEPWRAYGDSRVTRRWQATEKRLQALEAELAGVYRSTSWRLTRPLRVLKRLWGRGNPRMDTDGHG